MQKYQQLKPLLKQIMRLVGNGYKYISVSTIPEQKVKKTHKILEKLDKKYDLNLTTWQRQYKKRKGQANFKGLYFQDTIIILKTDGDTNINDNGFKEAINSEISLKYLSVILFLDERGKMTYRLNKELLRAIKANIEISLKNNKQHIFNKQIKKLYILHKVMPYRGFMLQLRSILEFIKEKQKQYNTKYPVPQFFQG